MKHFQSSHHNVLSIMDMEDSDSSYPIVGLAAVLSVVAYYLCLRAIPQAKDVLRDRGIYGIDINKITPKDMDRFRDERRNRVLSKFSDEFKKLLIPESLGIVVGAIYLAVVILLMVICRVPLARYNAAICSIALMLLLGFVDDVLDVRWRHKIVLSIISTTPIMLSYDGATVISLPSFLHDVQFLGPSIDLGIFYVIAMSLICVFCTNSINILAGVNGLEVGQSIVIGISVLVHNVVQLDGGNWRPNLISLVLCMPFVSCCLALYSYNRYPSKVFVGDSFTYFSGITLAVMAITGHFTKTLMLFFLPQLINFAISLPQLFGIIPCPRHRVPKWDSETDSLRPSMANGWCINLTLLNVMLVIFGPMKEGTLTNVLLAFQVLCSVIGFLIRYQLAALFYPIVE
eukprot:TRINITY_DN20253_c0_g1_i1.p1 TRINITY_DN20253_c0_g1~~TRINITY_DN20253_c0_g1_i1.p1  ORF type:complete len:417 (+),score=156.75 TRINITY_DN20253_c0_g1_i1:49-1251(+)